MRSDHGTDECCYLMRIQRYIQKPIKYLTFLQKQQMFGKGSQYTSGIGPILSITSYLQLFSIQHVILAAILMKSCIAEGYYSRRYILQVLFQETISICISICRPLSTFHRSARQLSGQSVCTVSTSSWIRIPLGPSFYMESKNLSSK